MSTGITINTRDSNWLDFLRAIEGVLQPYLTTHTWAQTSWNYFHSSHVQSVAYFSNPSHIVLRDYAGHAFHTICMPSHGYIWHDMINVISSYCYCYVDTQYQYVNEDQYVNEINEVNEIDELLNAIGMMVI